MGWDTFTTADYFLKMSQISCVIYGILGLIFLKCFLASSLDKFSNNMEFHHYEVHFMLSKK